MLQNELTCVFGKDVKRKYIKRSRGGKLDGREEKGIARIISHAEILPGNKKGRKKNLRDGFPSPA